MWKEKLGGYLIDVSKYILTGVVIASFFKDFQDSKAAVSDWESRFLSWS